MMFTRKKTVRSQQALDRIKPSTKAIILVAFGTYSQPAIIRTTYPNPVKVVDDYYAKVVGTSRAEAHDNSKLLVYDTAKVTLFDNACAVANDSSYVLALSDKNIVSAFDTSHVSVQSACTVYGFDQSQIQVHCPYSRIGKVGSKVDVKFIK